MFEVTTDKPLFLKALVIGSIGLLMLAVQKHIVFDFAQVPVQSMVLPIVTWLLLLSLIFAVLIFFNTLATKLITMPTELTDECDHNHRVMYRLMTLIFGFCYVVFIGLIFYGVDHIGIITKVKLIQIIGERYQGSIFNSDAHKVAVETILSWTSFDQLVLFLCALLTSSPVSKFFIMPFPGTLPITFVNLCKNFVNQISALNKNNLSRNNPILQVLLIVFFSVCLIFITILVIQYLCFKIVSIFFLTTDIVVFFNRGIIWSSSLGVIAGAVVATLGGWILLFRSPLINSIVKKRIEQQKEIGSE